MNTDNIVLDCHLVLAERKITLGELKKISTGSVVEFTRFAGEPADLYVNGVIIPENLIAKGEVVVVDDNFAFKVLEVNGMKSDDL